MIGTRLEAPFADVELIPGVPALMRDGARLVADIYRPKGDGPWPVLLMRTAYGRDVASGLVYAPPAWYARRGFMVVVQDVRGRGDSEGSYYPFRHEREDGYDSVQWAAGLDRSNGRVGLFGFSYQAVVQLFAALDRPPALCALAPHMTPFDLYADWFYRDGLLELWNLGWANQMLREDARRIGAPSTADLDRSWSDLGGLLRQLPLRRAAPLTNPDLPRYAADWLEHSTYDRYWEPWNLLLKTRELGYPMFHLSGWYDIFLRGSIAGYTALAKDRGDQFLLATPWAHSPWGTHVAGADFGPGAAPKVDEMVVEWFRHWLGPKAGQAPCPLSGCRYFSLGENRWRQSETWPPAGSRSLDLRLGSGGRANSRFGDGTLGEVAPGSTEDVLGYEPEVPVAAPGGGQGGMASYGPHELSVQQQSNSLLVYSSAELKQPVRIAGSPRLTVHVQATSPTLDLVARLSRVGRDGRTMFLCMGARRLRTANAVTAATVPLDPIAAHWSAGERIRLDLAASSFPLYPRNSGTAADALDVASPAEFGRALAMVYHDPSRPSSLSLPELPAD